MYVQKRLILWQNLDFTCEMKTHPIIVIGRQFGSGGRLVGRKLAEKLGVDYFDKELLAETARNYGINPELLAAGEERRPSRWRSILGLAYGTADLSQSGFSREKIYAWQSDVIRGVAERGACVIVGRTADYVAREYPGLASVFLHAPVDVRARHIVERGEAADVEAAAEMARRHDRLREAYYNYFTGRHWGRADNYHLSVDASAMSPATLVDLLALWLERRNS